MNMLFQIFTVLPWFKLEADLRKRALSVAYGRGPLVSILVDPPQKKMFSPLLSRQLCPWDPSTYLLANFYLFWWDPYLFGRDPANNIFMGALLTLLTLKSATAW